MSTLLAPALYSSMNEFVELVGESALTRNSLILIGLTFRAFSAVVSDCVLPFIAFVHETLPTRSPLKAASPEVTLKVALTLAPGATGPAIVTAVLVVPGPTEVQCLGTEILNLIPVAGARVELVNPGVRSADGPGENVWSPGALAGAAAGGKPSRCRSYLGATTLAGASWSGASEGNVPAAVIAPS